MLCDGITRESENPGSHALIRYLKSTVHWFGEIRRQGLGRMGGDVLHTTKLTESNS